jgi:hypothetical protein
MISFIFLSLSFSFLSFSQRGQAGNEIFYATQHGQLEEMNLPGFQCSRHRYLSGYISMMVEIIRR